MDELDFSEPVLPYAGTSGHSGSETSRERAVKADREGVTAKRQQRALGMMGAMGNYGVTWQELATSLDLHHGSASGVLSVLHKAGKICRLKETRNQCKIYVLPEFVHGREIERHGGKNVGQHICAGVVSRGNVVSVCTCVSQEMYHRIMDHARLEIIREVEAFANDYHHHVNGRDVVIVDQLLTFLGKVENDGN